MSDTDDFQVYKNKFAKVSVKYYALLRYLVKYRYSKSDDKFLTNGCSEQFGVWWEFLSSRYCKITAEFADKKSSEN